MATILAKNQRSSTSSGAHLTSQATMTSPLFSYHKPSKHRCGRNSSLIQPRSSDKTSPLLLHPSSRIQWHRHALSVDETGFGDRSGDSGAVEMATAGCSRMRDRNKRSDTARRHVLSRQKPIEKDEQTVHGVIRGSTSRR